MKSLIVLLAFIFLLGCVSNLPFVCTADAKICPDGTGVGRSGPLCEFAPCPQPKVLHNADIQLPENYVADESTIPLAVEQKFEDVISTYSLGGRLSFCRLGDEGFYLVSGSSGYSGMLYYFSYMGADLGIFGWDDIIEPGEPKPPFDTTKYPCTTIKEDLGSYPTG